MLIELSAPSLLLLVGASGCGKSTFARRHFRETEIVSSDRFRAMIVDDEADQSASREAFELVHATVERRLAHGKLVVVDSTAVQPSARAPLIALAARAFVPVMAIVFDLPEELCLRRNASRAGRTVDPGVVSRQMRLLAERPPTPAEGFRTIFIIRSEIEAGQVIVRRAGHREA